MELPAASALSRAPQGPEGMVCGQTMPLGTSQDHNKGGEFCSTFVGL